MFFKGLDRDYWNNLLRASLVGIHLVTATFLGLAMGYFLDKWLGTKPWLTMIFLLLGIAAGFKNMYQEVKSIQDSEAKKDQKNDGPHS